MNLKTLSFLALAVFCLMSACPEAPAASEGQTLAIPGSGACEAVLIRLAAAFNETRPGATVTIPKSTGSSGGIRAVAEGSHPMGRVARSLKAAEAGKGLAVLPFAYDAVIFAVGEAVPVTSLSAQHLAGIFNGKIKNWQTVGGPDLPIRVLTRQADETSMKIISRSLPAFRDLVITQEAKTAYHDYEMVDLLNKFRSSIGFLTSGSLTDPGTRIRPLTIDGVRPTADNLSSGRYPMKVALGFVYRRGELAGLPLRFVDFVFSGKGRAVIEALGLFPAERKE